MLNANYPNPAESAAARQELSQPWLNHLKRPDIATAIGNVSEITRLIIAAREDKPQPEVTIEAYTADGFKISSGEEYLVITHPDQATFTIEFVAASSRLVTTRSNAKLTRLPGPTAPLETREKITADYIQELRDSNRNLQPYIHTHSEIVIPGNAKLS